nr:plastocyanin/azurin family copper-binding protein [Natrinema longum]
MTLEEGAEYVLVWENGDGLQHNVAIEDESGEELLASDFMSEEGTTQSVTVTASAEMAEYYCQVHPESMRGTIDVQ